EIQIPAATRELPTREAWIPVTQMPAAPTPAAVTMATAIRATAAPTTVRISRPTTPGPTPARTTAATAARRMITPTITGVIDDCAANVVGTRRVPWAFCHRARRLLLGPHSCR